MSDLLTQSAARRREADTAAVGLGLEGSTGDIRHLSPGVPDETVFGPEDGLQCQRTWHDSPARSWDL